MSAPTPRFERYTHGHHAAIVASHAQRTAENSAGFLLPYLERGQRLLDVGCGPGSITVDLAELVAPGPVVGVDREPAVLEGARRLGEERGLTNLTFEPADVYTLPYPDDQFDVVYAHQVLRAPRRSRGGADRDAAGTAPGRSAGGARLGLRHDDPRPP